MIITKLNINHKIFLVIIWYTIFMSLGAFAQSNLNENNAIVFENSDNEKIVIPYCIINSISHEVINGKVSAKFSSTLGDYSIPIVADVTHLDILSIPELSSGWTKLPKNVIREWDQAIVNNEGLLVFQKETQDFTYLYCISTLEEGNNNWLFLSYTKDNLAAEIISSDLYCIISNDEQNISHVFIYQNHDEIYDFELSENDAQLKSLYKANSNNANGIGNIMNQIQGEYFPNKPSIWDSLQGIAEQCADYINPFFGHFAGDMLDYLKNSLQEYRNKTLNILFGNCNVEIIDAENSNNNYYDYTLRVQINGIESVPRNKYNGKQVPVYYGVIVKNGGIPYLDDNDIRKGEFITYDDVETSIPLGELEISSTYDAVPYLFSKAQLEFIKHCNWGNNNGKNAYDIAKFGKEFFITTHTPGISIGPAQNSTCTSSEIPYSLSFPPSSSTISLLVSNEVGQEMTIQIPKEPESSILSITDLTPGSNYYCVGRLSYKSFLSSDACNFSTLSPSISLDKVVEKDQHSATLSYSVTGNLNEASYILICTDGKTTLSQNLSLNSSVTTISGLEAMTDYSCYAKIIYRNKEWRSNDLSFETEYPDVSGTWTCTQKNYNKFTDKYTEESYTITLNADGSVSSSKYSNILSGSWSYSKNGKLSISIMDLATQSANHGVNWSFAADNIKEPHTFTGSVYGWNWNSVVGYVQGDGSSCTLSR